MLDKILTENGGVRWYARVGMIVVGIAFFCSGGLFSLVLAASALESNERMKTWRPVTAKVVCVIRTAADGSSVEILGNETITPQDLTDQAASAPAKKNELIAFGYGPPRGPRAFGMTDDSPFVIVRWAYVTEAGQAVGERYVAREVKNKDRYLELRKMAPGDTFALWYNPASPEQWTDENSGNAVILGVLLFLIPFTLSGATGILGGLLNRPALAAKVEGGGLGGLWFVLAAAACFLLYFLPWPVGMYAGLLIAAGAHVYAFGGLVKEIISPTPLAMLIDEDEDDENEDEYEEEDEDTPPEPVQPSREQRGDRTPFWWSLLRVGGPLALAGFVGVFVYFFVIRDIVLYRQVESYVSTQGTVLGSAVKETRSDDGTSHRPWVKYSYEVSGRTYVSSVYRVGSDDYDETESGEIVAAHAIGQPVTVWYDAADPSKAVLSKDRHRGSFFGFIFLSPFIMVAVGALWRVVAAPAFKRSVRRFISSDRAAALPCRLPGWGVLKRSFHGWVLRRRPDPFSRFVNFATGYGISCFVAIFVTIGVALVRDETPTRLPSLYFVAVIGAAAAIGLYRMHRKSGGGVSVKQHNGLLTVIDTAGRSHELGFDEIKHWSAKTGDSKVRVNNVAIKSTTVVLHTRRGANRRGMEQTIDIQELYNPTMSNDVDMNAAGRRIAAILSKLTRE